MAPEEPKTLIPPQVRAEFKKRIKLQFPTVMADRIVDLLEEILLEGINLDEVLGGFQQQLNNLNATVNDVEARVTALENPSQGT